MAKTPSFLFHVPHMGNDMLSYEELESAMRKRNAPKLVMVIDAESKKRLGALPSSIALLKFK